MFSTNAGKPAVEEDGMHMWRDEPTVYRHLDFSDCKTFGEVHV